MSAIVEAELISSPMLVPRVSDLPPLTHKQTLFVRHYLETRNGTESARKAGYDTDENTLRAIACENLTKPSIQSHIQHALKQRQISPDEVLAELSDIAIAPWKNFLQVKYGPNNEVIDAQLRLTDKIKSLDILADLLNMRKDDQNTQDLLTSTRELVTILNDCMARAREAQSAPRLPASVDTPTS